MEAQRVKRKQNFSDIIPSGRQLPRTPPAEAWSSQPRTRAHRHQVKEKADSQTPVTALGGVPLRLDAVLNPAVKEERKSFRRSSTTSASAKMGDADPDSFIQGMDGYQWTDTDLEFVYQSKQQKRVQQLKQELRDLLKPLKVETHRLELAVASRDEIQAKLSKLEGLGDKDLLSQLKPGNVQQVIDEETAKVSRLEKEVTKAREIRDKEEQAMKKRDDCQKNITLVKANIEAMKRELELKAQLSEKKEALQAAQLQRRAPKAPKTAASKEKTPNEKKTRKVHTNDLEAETADQNAQPQETKEASEAAQPQGRVPKAPKTAEASKKKIPKDKKPKNRNPKKKTTRKVHTHDLEAETADQNAQSPETKGTQKAKERVRTDSRAAKPKAEPAEVTAKVTVRNKPTKEKAPKEKSAVKVHTNDLEAETADQNAQPRETKEASEAAQPQGRVPKAPKTAEASKEKTPKDKKPKNRNPKEKTTRKVHTHDLEAETADRKIQPPETKGTQKAKERVRTDSRAAKPKAEPAEVTAMVTAKKKTAKEKAPKEKSAVKVHPDNLEAEHAHQGVRSPATEEASEAAQPQGRVPKAPKTAEASKKKTPKDKKPKDRKPKEKTTRKVHTHDLEAETADRNVQPPETKGTQKAKERVRTVSRAEPAEVTAKVTVRKKTTKVHTDDLEAEPVHQGVQFPATEEIPKVAPAAKRSIKDKKTTKASADPDEFTKAPPREKAPKKKAPSKDKASKDMRPVTVEMHTEALTEQNLESSKTQESSKPSRARKVTKPTKVLTPPVPSERDAETFRRSKRITTKSQNQTGSSRGR